jgi:hypothetical protein
VAVKKELCNKKIAEFSFYAHVDLSKETNVVLFFTFEKQVGHTSIKKLK